MKLHRILLLFVLLTFTIDVWSQDPNFYIYLCFGQSNMEGQGIIEAQDRTVDSRLQVLEAVSCSNLGRTKGNWYKAVPPLTRCWSGLSPADYFGRTMVQKLPDSIRIGIVNVSVAGCKIELYDKNNYQTYAATVESWMKNIITEYGGNPYGRLVEMAKLTQQEGVIKGILLHQGESNTGDTQWPAKVKGVYDDLINDLGLNPDSVPLLAGEVVHADQGGLCASMNAIIAKLPQTIPNSYVISSSQCTDGPDNIHFDSEGYRKLGKRYAKQMLTLMGIDVSDLEEKETTVDSTRIETAYYEPECATIGNEWEIVNDATASGGKYVSVKPGIQSIALAATDSVSLIRIPFTVNVDSTYYIYGLMNCFTPDDDSFWIKVDDGAFSVCNNLVTVGWKWKNMNTYNLTKGEHVLTICYREDGAKLDKICISNDVSLPTGKGEKAENYCLSDTPVGITDLNSGAVFRLDQNFPNPFSDETTISFEITRPDFVSLKVFNLMGLEVAELAGKNYNAGKHQVVFQSGELPGGNYLYTLKTDNFITTRKMIIRK